MAIGTQTYHGPLSVTLSGIPDKTSAAHKLKYGVCINDLNKEINDSRKTMMTSTYLFDRRMYNVDIEISSDLINAYKKIISDNKHLIGISIHNIGKDASDAYLSEVQISLTGTLIMRFVIPI